MTTITMGKALNEALRDALRDDPRVLVYGEDVGRLGGVFRVTDGLRAEFGEERVFDTPLAESTIAAIAVGLAIKGFHPVAEMQFDAFSYPAFNQITSNLAKYHTRTQGACNMQAVIRIPYGGNIGAVEHHSESPETYYVHTAGLKVVTPSTPADAYGLLRAAIADPDPVIFLEPKARYWSRQDLDLPAPPLPLDRAQIVRPGTDGTIIAYGPTVQVALAAAEAAEAEGASLEVVDLRSLSPLDLDTLSASVRKTKRAVVVHEAPVFMGIGAEIAARLMHDLFDVLAAPVERVGSATVPYPPARVEKLFLPDADRVLEAVDRTRQY
ncbi:MAG: Branched-chain alpha-keto acid dehydrogenase, E1 component, beta subunit [Ktedonobacterales bacterium]|jgi:pyruvate dehydrogenase E1 component beta subunit|nr:MAG: Branched-chain alpha-keto acid dehydrogenase, E1 component, beta subunit [Ktedonobacterales bacterium]